MNVFLVIRRVIIIIGGNDGLPGRMGRYVDRCLANTHTHQCLILFLLLERLLFFYSILLYFFSNHCFILLARRPRPDIRQTSNPRCQHTKCHCHYYRRTQKNLGYNVIFIIFYLSLYLLSHSISEGNIFFYLGDMAKV